MTASFTFNGTDMEGLGLYCAYPVMRPRRDIAFVQLPDKGVKLESSRPPLEISLLCDVSAATHAALVTALDSIKAALIPDNLAQLTIDIISGRYWTAQCTGLEPASETAINWTGTITFLALDPVAFDSTETSSDYNIDADPKSVIETTGGNQYIEPVYTLTAGENLGEVEITLENETTGETIAVTVTMTTNDVLVIDVANWTVKLNGTEVMDGLGSDRDFPRLAANTNNTITVDGFSTTGTLNIKYRNRYA
jgi:archaellum component FlaF (FlaF/FlaG flagellin family)